MRRQSHTIYDGLREQISRNGAWKQPAPWDERPAADSSVHAQMDTSGIGQAWTTARSSRTYAGGGITPQRYTTAQPANVEDILTDAGQVMNTRPALPNRGITPRSPLMRRG